MRKITIILSLIFIINITAKADEGMWLPILLQQLNEKEMKSMGMRISAEDIYSVNKSSLKDAIVIFGGGCTGEVVSDKGLIFTNHHCGYGNIQKHSTLENDYLSNGFWANSFEEELPNPGLSVTFFVSMEDVTEQVLKDVTDNMSMDEKEKLIEKNSKNIIENTDLKPNTYAEVESFYYGNQYFLIVYKKYTDVRLVGAPPSNIGKFGGDVDNWMWPRHTGDFAVFRIYADENNEPAEYSKDNVPFKPNKHLTISLKGIEENDFVFIFGFPGSTREYIPAVAVDQIVNGFNPISIHLRGKKIDVIEKARNNDPLIKIQYASKSAGIANGWKKMIGESRGIRITKGIEEKISFEKEFTKWAEQNAPKYKNLLPEYDKLYNKYGSHLNNMSYYRDGLLGIEILRFAANFKSLIEAAQDKNTSDSAYNVLLARLSKYATNFYKDYNVDVDKNLFVAMIDEYISNCPQNLQSKYITSNYEKNKNSDRWSNSIYSKTIFADSSKIFDMLNSGNKKLIRNLHKDPAYLLGSEIIRYYNYEIVPELLSFYSKFDSLQNHYMAAQLEMQPDKRFYPDANFTLRVGYGNILPFHPADGVKYNWFTTLDGIIQKENPEISDYYVDPKLKELYYKKDYGQYADKDGTLHVGFIASNHTTGGNSGSPVFNADGQLIGLNFDRCWEGTMSDIKYDINLCRNISVDIRYCLFIIDKFAGATRIIDELTIVK
ncbi:MAG: S46 family peptidase [Lentimicrobiaceae bacterium]|nr:S46 family peptidase [Lentimicrobiaceae bacterium]